MTQTRPTNAGIARLEYGALPPGLLAIRDGNVIQLPADLEPENIVPILGGKNLLIKRRVQWRDVHVLLGQDSTGGVFASPLAIPVADHNYLRTPKGEESFLRSLMPQALLAYSERVGVELVRQGDWFFAAVAPGHPKLGNYLTHIGKDGFAACFEPRPTVDESLLNTRHCLTGQRYMPLKGKNPRVQMHGLPVVIFTGTVTAPDHKAFHAAVPTIGTPTQAFQRIETVGVDGRTYIEPKGD